jgi:hypothetical protein
MPKKLPSRVKSDATQAHLVEMLEQSFRTSAFERDSKISLCRNTAIYLLLSTCKCPFIVSATIASCIGYSKNPESVFRYFRYRPNRKQCNRYMECESDNGALSGRRLRPISVIEGLDESGN